MNNTRITFMCFCLLGFFFSSCHDLEEGVQNSRDWAIYRLADATVTSDQIRNESLLPDISQGGLSRSIQLPQLHEGGDPRSDMQIYWALKNAGVLMEE